MFLSKKLLDFTDSNGKKDSMKHASIADLQTVTRAIGDGKPVIELFKTENCPTLDQLIVGKMKASKVFPVNGLRDDIIYESEDYYDSGMVLEYTQLKKDIGMIGKASSEATIHDIDEKKSKFVTDRGIKKQLVVKVSLFPVNVKDESDPFYIESLASFLLAQDDVINFTSMHGSFVCGGLGYMIMEKFDGTLSEAKKIIGRDMSEDDDVRNMYFQVLASLHYMQVKYKMVHHDLHGDNVMLQKVKKGGYFKYNINGKEYKIKNLGFVVKIIDFGFATFTFRKKRYYRSDMEKYQTIENGNYSTKFDKAYDVMYTTLMLDDTLESDITEKAVDIIFESGDKMTSDRKFDKNKQWTLTKNHRPYGKLPSELSPLLLIKKLYKQYKTGSWSAKEQWFLTNKPVKPVAPKLKPVKARKATPKIGKKKAKKSDCGGRTVIILKNLARDKKIKGYSKLNKEELCIKLGLKF